MNIATQATQPADLAYISTVTRERLCVLEGLHQARRFREVQYALASTPKVRLVDVDRGR